RGSRERGVGVEAGVREMLRERRARRSRRRRQHEDEDCRPGKDAERRREIGRAHWGRGIVQPRCQRTSERSPRLIILLVARKATHTRAMSSAMLLLGLGAPSGSHGFEERRDPGEVFLSEVFLFYLHRVEKLMVDPRSSSLVLRLAKVDSLPAPITSAARPSIGG